MGLGEVTLAALALAVILSCTSRLNVGLLAIALAWVIGVYVGHLPLREVTAGFPIDLFLTLAGVTLLFSQAHVNGTLDIVAHNAMRLCRGRVGLVPIMYFALGAAIASAGPGNIATTGLLAPVAMATALRMRISPFLMAIMVGNGCNSGSLSPLAPTGIIVTGLMSRIGLPGLEIQTWAYNLLAHAIVAFAGYFIFGGFKLLMRAERVEIEHEPRQSLDRHQAITLAMIGMLIVGVVFGGFNIGMAAFAAAVLLTLLRAADDAEAIKRMPWSTIVMVCGVTVLIGLLEKTGGMKIFTDLLSSIATQHTVVPELAVIIGVVSAYSSTSGVVLPAFLPTVPGLAQNLGLENALGLASTMNVAGHLVDVSPLSTIGALCIAGIPAGEASRRLFNQLLAWGMSMTVVGAVLCWILFA
ncbi:MAG TPA: SLC13 family permease [Gammaproteobacteria bacterium]|jgi:Na+/H+ antiporter NhaD/arsenite permease-like protein|nr:SLC13 family permease [Gammaproteobacteria bacterium]